MQFLDLLLKHRLALFPSFTLYITLCIKQNKEIAKIPLNKYSLKGVFIKKGRIRLMR